MRSDAVFFINICNFNSRSLLWVELCILHGISILNYLFLTGMNVNKIKQKGYIISISEYIIFSTSSLLYILNFCSNCYVWYVILFIFFDVIPQNDTIHYDAFSYYAYMMERKQWFATAIALMILFSLFTQVFSHIFFTYNNIGDKGCSPYLQRINSKSGSRLEIFRLFLFVFPLPKKSVIYTVLYFSQKYLTR